MLKPFVLLCFFFSGFSGLLYEVLWLRLLILIFGSTTLAISTVLTAFMGGLALGSYFFGRMMDRQKRPLLYYGILEGVIGLYALIIPWIFSGLIPVYQFLWQQFHLNFYGFTLAAILTGYRGPDHSHHLYGRHLAHPEHLGRPGRNHPGSDHRPALRLKYFRGGAGHRPQRFFPVARPGGSTYPVDRRGHKPAGRPADPDPAAPVSRANAGDGIAGVQTRWKISGGHLGSSAQKGSLVDRHRDRPFRIYLHDLRSGLEPDPVPPGGFLGLWFYHHAHHLPGRDRFRFSDFFPLGGSPSVIRDLPGP